MSDNLRLFSYSNGSGTVYADPWRLQRALSAAADGNLGDLYERAFPGDFEPTPLQQGVIDGAAARASEAEPDESKKQESAERERQNLLGQFRRRHAESAAEALDLLVAAVRKGFGLPGIDPATGSGVTDEECLDSLHAWFEWRAKKNESRGKTPTSPAPSGSPDSSPSSPTSTSSASG